MVDEFSRNDAVQPHHISHITTILTILTILTTLSQTLLQKNNDESDEIGENKIGLVDERLSTDAYLNQPEIPIPDIL